MIEGVLLPQSEGGSVNIRPRLKSKHSNTYIILTKFDRDLVAQRANTFTLVQTIEIVINEAVITSAGEAPGLCLEHINESKMGFLLSGKKYRNFLVETMSPYLCSTDR